MSDALPIAGLLATGARGGSAGLSTGLPLPLGTVNLEALPSSLQSLGRPLLLTGQLSAVTGQAAGNAAAGAAADGAEGGNLFRLSTSSGEILLRSPLNLRPGQGFLLQIPAGNPPRGAVLLTTNNTLGAAGPTATGGAGAGAASAAATATIATGAPNAAAPLPATIGTPATLPALSVGLNTTAQLLPVVQSSPTTPGAPLPAQGTVPLTPTGNTVGSAAAPVAGSAAAPATASPLANVPNTMASTVLASLLSERGADGAQTPRPGAPAGDARAASASGPSTGSFGGGAASAANGQASGSLANATPQAFGQANNLGDIRILAIARPGQTLPPAPTAPLGTPGGTGGAAAASGSTNAAPPTIITATVIQATAEGPTLLRFGEQMILMQARGALPEGTRLQLALPMALANTAGDGPDPLLSGGRWGALQEASQFLQAVNPTAAQALNASLPQVGAANLGTSMIFFMAALKIGDMRAWLGENTLRSLERFGNRDVLDRLSSDFGRLAQQADEVLPGNWRPISVPLAHQGDIGLLNFYIKPINPDEQRETHDDGGDEAAGKAGETRFVIDMDMSELGRMQVDGLAQPGRVDVVLRSMATFPNNMRQELQGLFRDVLEARGLQGGVTFRHHGEGWVKLTRQNWDQPASSGEAPPPLTA